MTLRTRLLLSLGSLLLVALLVSGSLVVGITRASLVQHVDEQLRDVRPQDLGRPGPGRGSFDDPTGRRFALLVLDADGQLVEWMPSGFPRNPDPLPALPAPGEPALPVGRVVERPAVDGSLSYRLLTLQTRDGSLTGVVAAPLRQVEEATGVLLQALLIVGAAVVLLSIAAGWL
ncbi:MAG: hypothetical protein M3253_04585, partial [Chloroflexota bacterium]|nr:hypothetical protein [Chloroflexota bacterium]